MNTSDTIVALATPQGVGALAVIRMSGTDAIRITSQLFPTKDLTIQPSHTVHVGHLYDGEIVLDEVVVTLFKEPRSFTRENSVEITCHGSHIVVKEILKALNK